MDAAGAAGATGAELLHPPKSSSGVILGGPEFDCPNPLLVEATWLVTGSDPPHAEKSFCIVIAAGFTGALAFGLIVSAGAGSGVDHASLDPQASELEKAPKFADGAFWVEAVFFAVSEGAAAAERLKGEARLAFLLVSILSGAEKMGAGSSMLKRSFDALGIDG